MYLAHRLGAAAMAGAGFLGIRVPIAGIKSAGGNADVAQHVQRGGRIPEAPGLGAACLAQQGAWTASRDDFNEERTALALEGDAGHVAGDVRNTTGCSATRQHCMAERSGGMLWPNEARGEHAQMAIVVLIALVKISKLLGGQSDRVNYYLIINMLWKITKVIRNKIGGKGYIFV